MCPRRPSRRRPPSVALAGDAPSGAEVTLWLLSGLTTNQKGLLAENPVIGEAIQLGIGVSGPLDDERYDLIPDLRPGPLRTQCTWATRVDGVVVVRCSTSRRGPAGILARRSVTGEIDVFGVPCAELDTCYLLPRDELDGKRSVHLRLAPCKHNQLARINM